MNIFNTLPRKTLLLVLFLVALLLILLYFLFFKPDTPNTVGVDKNPQATVPTGQPKTPPQETPSYRTFLTSKTSQNYTITFDIPEGFTLPSSTETIEVQREINLSYLNQLKEDFSIKGDPTTVGSKYFWVSNQTGSLMVDTESGYVQYNPGGSNLSTRITESQAIEYAEDFLNKTSFANVTPNTAEVKMFTGNEELFETDNLNEATMFEISYIQSVKGIPIYYHFATPARIYTLVDLSGNIKELRYFNIQPIKTTKTTVLSLEEIKNDVLDGNYQIVNIGGDPQTIPPTGEITINTATLAHFDDKKNPTFFPTVILRGILQPSNREVFLYYSVLR